MRLNVLPIIEQAKISRKTCCYLVILILMLLVGLAVPRHLTVTKTDSVDYHLFWGHRKAVPARSDYVRLQLFDGAVNCSPCSIVKRIGCMPGDQLTVEDWKYYCNGDILGEAMMNEHRPPFEFNGTVPPGSVFLIGDKETSYDSRYFGLKPLDDIETVLRPLF